MRIQRKQHIAGLPAPIARAIVRNFDSPRVAQIAAPSVGGSVAEANAAVSRLAEAGFLRQHHEDRAGDAWWIATIEGNALAMASFARPIMRTTADRLLAEVIERARTYNCDPSHIRYIDRLRVFGSYLNVEQHRLGDLDLEIVVGRRDNSSQAALDYAKRSGRSFRSFLDKLTWADVELIRFLKNRSGAINLTQEDVSEITDRHRVVYSIENDESAIPAAREH